MTWSDFGYSDDHSKPATLSGDVWRWTQNELGVYSLRALNLFMPGVIIIPLHGHYDPGVCPPEVIIRNAEARLLRAADALFR